MIDLAGQTLAVGDLVAYPYRTGKTASSRRALALGTITRFTPLGVTVYTSGTKRPVSLRLEQVVKVVR